MLPRSRIGTSSLVSIKNIQPFSLCQAPCYSLPEKCTTSSPALHLPALPRGYNGSLLTLRFLQETAHILFLAYTAPFSPDGNIDKTDIPRIFAAIHNNFQGTV